MSASRSTARPPLLPKRGRRRVAFDGISPFHLSVPCMVFGPDMAGAGVPRFELRVCAVERAPLRTTAGFCIAARAGCRRWPAPAS